jgi:hypothetical protein
MSSNDAPPIRRLIETVAEFRDALVYTMILGSLGGFMAWHAVRDWPPITAVLVGLVTFVLVTAVLFGAYTWLVTRLVRTAEAQGRLIGQAFAAAHEYAAGRSEAAAREEVLAHIRADEHAKLVAADGAPVPAELPEPVAAVFREFRHVEVAGMTLALDEVGPSELVDGFTRAGSIEVGEVLVFPDGTVDGIDMHTPADPDAADPLTPWRWLLREIRFLAA